MTSNGMTFLDVTRVQPRPSPLKNDVYGTELTLFDLTVPDGWQQGAGAFGGWVMAALVRAMEGVVPARALRSLTAEIPSPVQPGDATIAVEVLRAGQSVTTLAARLVQSAQLQAHAVGIFGAPRRLTEEMDRVELTAPVAPDWREILPIPPETPNVPKFARHFEFRLADGLPFRGAEKSGALGWIRLRDLPSQKDAALVAAHVDAWWPAEFARLAHPRTMVTAAFSMQIVGGADAWKTDAPLLHASRTQAVREGYVTEVRELWTEDGVLVALNEQTMVIVR
jgi:acyl-CoA thioesterase